MISVKFGEMVGGWTTSDIKGGLGTGLWKEIKKKTRLTYPKMLASPWETVGGCAFGRTLGAGR